MNKMIFIFFTLMIFLSIFVLGEEQIVLSPNVFQGWNYHFNGNESALYNLRSLADNKICIIPKDIALKPITREENDFTRPTLDASGEISYEKKNVIYTYPPSINLYTSNKATPPLIKSLTLDREPDNSVCFTLDYMRSPYYRIGESSIILNGMFVYNSTNTNVTNENQFTHLNLSDTSIIMYIPFDVNSGTSIIGYTNNSYDGTINNAVWNSTGKYGGCIEINSSATPITIDKDTSSLKFNTTGFTAGGWVKYAGTTSALGEIIAKYGSVASLNKEWALRIHTTGGARFFVSKNGSESTSPSVISSAKLNDSQWHHVMGVYNTSTIILYFDGLLNASTVSVGMFSGEMNITIGHFSGTDIWNGSLDEIMLFNRPLNSSEISQIYNSQFPRFLETGEQTFKNIYLGKKDLVNISISNCQTLNGSSLLGRINEGAYAPFVGCNLTNYAVTGNLTNANLTIFYNSTALRFYSPIVAGNITIDGWLSSLWSSSVYTYIDGIRGNKNIVLGNIVNLTGVLITGSGNINLTVNGVRYASGSSPLTNLTNLSSAGVYSIKTIYDGDGENYSSSSETWTLYVSEDKCNGNYTYLKVGTFSKPYVRLCNYYSFTGGDT